MQDKAVLNFEDAPADSAEGVGGLVGTLIGASLSMFFLAEVENNFLFLLNFYATFAAEGIPDSNDFQATSVITIYVKYMSVLILFSFTFFNSIVLQVFSLVAGCLLQVGPVSWPVCSEHAQENDQGHI